MPAFDRKRFVSSHGRYMDALGRKKFPKPRRNGRVYIHARGRTYSFPRAVLWAFKGPPPDRKGDPCDADHINSDPMNNSVANLRWLSRSINRGRGNIKGRSRKLQWRIEMFCCPGDGELIGPWESLASVKEVAKRLKVQRHRVYASLRSKTPIISGGGQVYRLRPDYTDLPGEQWRSIVVPENKTWSEERPTVLKKADFGHEVSSYGRLRKSPTSGPYLPHVNKENYATAVVDHSRHYVHRLVWYAFYGLPTSSEEVIDHVIERYEAGKYFNRLDNLNSVSRGENNRKSASNDNRTCSKRRLQKAVVGLAKDTGEKIEWPSLGDAAQFLKVSLGTACKLIQSMEVKKGYCLVYKDQLDLPGEVWAPLPEGMFQCE